MLVSDVYGRARTGVGDEVEDYANLYYEATNEATTDATTAPSYPATIGGTVLDGTFTFIASDSWGRYARGQAVDSFNIQLDYLPDSRASDSFREWAAR